MKVIWANRSEWKKPGPIVYIGLLNALSFAQLDYETHYFISEGTPSNTSEDLENFYGVTPHPGLNIHRIAKGSKLSEIPARKIYRQAIAFCKKELAAGESVLFLTRELGLLALLARLQRSYPTTLRTIYEAHDFHADFSERDLKIKFTDHRKRLTERLFLPQLSALLCITPPQEKCYRRVFPDMNIMTHILGCLERLKSTEEEIEQRRLKRTVVYVGLLQRYKGVHDLLGQADFFHQHNLKLHLLGGKQEQIDKLKKKLPANSPIHFFPSMPPSKLHQHLENHASIGIVPLQNSFYNRALTCPVKALDSLSHHLPVIATDLPTTRAVVGDAGIYLSPEQPTQFPHAARELLDDPKQYLELSLNAAKRSEELSWKHRAQMILNSGCQ
ncbi:MAG: glycosyltransferase [Verrucomicrobia bacterium]|nr:glycosyltransferase [Verrucomicrobiota bacterium]